MTGFSNSPKVLKGGLILIDPASGAVLRVIALQYNPDLLTRSLQPQSTGGSAAISEPLRLKGPPVETIKLDAEIDATDQLEFPISTLARSRSASTRNSPHWKPSSTRTATP
ncbi:hypothetical protein [Pseudomonas sp. S2_F03]